MWGQSPYPSIVPTVAARKALVAARSGVLTACLLAVTLMGPVGCGSGTSPEVEAGPGNAPDPVLVQGRAVYVDRCVSCHGADGSGIRIGPRLNQGWLVQEYPNLEDAATVVAEGRDRMPAFEGALSAHEIDAVLRYIVEVL